MELGRDPSILPNGTRVVMMWFDPRRSLVLRINAILLLLFASGPYMYVWCELFMPRRYSGPLRGRYGLVVSNGDYRILGGA
jgi:hypothetical protein